MQMFLKILFCFKMILPITFLASLTSISNYFAPPIAMNSQL